MRHFVYLLLISCLFVVSGCLPTMPMTLRGGINMGDMLEAPNEGDWGLTVPGEYFDLIKEAGFDFVRLPVRWNAYAQESAPYTIGPTFFARIEIVIGWAL